MKGARGAKQVQADILANRVGLSGAKYSSCEELEKFAERKQHLAEKVAYLPESWADPEPFGSGKGTIDMPKVLQSGLGGMASGIAGGITSAGLSAIGGLITGTARSLKERLVLNKQREKIVDDIAENDPIVSVFEKEDPGSSIRAYSTLVRTAPTLSLDPNIATAFLRNAAQTGGPLDFQTIKLLADAEYSLKKARGDIKGGR
jgi:hypothetical protein